MNKSEILDRIRNRLTLPRAFLQVMHRMDPQCQQAIEEIDALIQEMERPAQKDGRGLRRD